MNSCCPAAAIMCRLTGKYYMEQIQKKINHTVHDTLSFHKMKLPLAPAYATTVHSSQGKTLPAAVLLDLQVDKAVDPTIGTVATARVRSREDVLIMRPFPKFLSVGEQTCRSQYCKRKWALAEENQPEDAKRQRSCPACRRR